MKDGSGVLDSDSAKAIAAERRARGRDGRNGDPFMELKSRWYVLRR
jgi:hypothetical protein